MCSQLQSPAVYRQEDPVPTAYETGWASGPVWTGAENLAPNGFRFPHRRARSNSLYRLSYPGPLTNMHFKFFQYQCV